MKPYIKKQLDARVCGYRCCWYSVLALFAGGLGLYYTLADSRSWLPPGSLSLSAVALKDRHEDNHSLPDVSASAQQKSILLDSIQSSNDTQKPIKHFDTKNSSLVSSKTYEDNSTAIATQTNTDAVVVMYWTTIYRKDWAIFYGQGEHTFRRCEFNRCSTTSDKSQLKNAKLLLFYHMDPPNFPDVRYPGQLYMHFTMDPPRTKEQTYLDQYENVLNLTANYRPTADIYNSHGLYLPLETPNSGIYTPRVPFGNRTGSIAWMVSHCLTNSKRHLYVNELKRYIDVDIYGACGNNSCPKTLGSAHCFERLGQKYKFYLAFENNICPDYASEKLTEALTAEMVPVVFGMANYKSNIAPPNSVIDVRDFKSPRDLATFLRNMSEEAYQQYFQWRMTHSGPSIRSMFCEICKLLHSEKYNKGEQFVPSYKSYGGYRKWWQDTCDNGLIERMRQNGGW